jgi:hypothetical protein
MQPDAQECCLDVLLDFLQFRDCVKLGLVLVDLASVFPELRSIKLLGSIEKVRQLYAKVCH